MRWILTLALVSFLIAAALFVAEVKSYAKSVDPSAIYGAKDHNLLHSGKQLDPPNIPGPGAGIPPNFQPQVPDPGQFPDDARMRLQQGLSRLDPNLMRPPDQSGDPAGMRPTASGGTPAPSETGSEAASRAPEVASVASASASASASPAPEEEPTALPDTGGISLLLPAAAFLIISNVLGLVAVRRALSFETTVGH
jgi:hypothetical protein